MKKDERLTGVVVNFTFPPGAEEKYRSALLPCAPHVHDKIKSIVPGSGVYSVKSVAFVIDDFTSSTNLPHATIEVELEPLDEVSKP
ncbi:MAG: hypothetical protein FJ399_13540 [Verrucomicrobia bacterium]|nr:hypothetical protein [Verrucomicrobiota bacterium]